MLTEHKRMNHGVIKSPESLSEVERERANSEFDCRSERQPGHELGVPGFARLQAELSEEELAEKIWDWHTRNDEK